MLLGFKIFNVVLKSPTGNLMKLGNDKMGSTSCNLKDGFAETIYLSENMTADEATAVLGHEVFVHVENAVNIFSKLDAGQYNNKSLFKNLTDISSSGSIDHMRLSQGKATSYVKFILELATIFNNPYYVQYYNNDIQKHK